jgi:hypothetical protein
MLTVTTEQARNRFRTVAPVLQNAIFSVQTAEIIDRIASENHLDDDRSLVLAEVVGWVLLGFIHPEDVAGELQGRASIPSPTATAIASAVTAKIFSPLKTDLDNAYAPVSHEHEETAFSPKIIQDIGPMPGAFPPPAPSPPVPKSSEPQSGWSRATPEQPVVKLSQAAVPAAATAPQAPPKAVPTAPPPAAKPPTSPAAAGAMDEFERLAAQRGEKKAVPSPAGGAPPTAPKPAAPEPPPVMIHEDTEFKAQPQAPGFRLELPAKPIDMRAGPPPPQPVKSAMLELGSTPAPPPKTGPATTRVVHYTEYKSPSPEHPVLPKTPPPPQGPRQITEITSQDLSKPPPVKPPVPPAPPKPPLPPAPPAPPPPNKVIYKDYSESKPPQPPQPPKPPVPPPPPTTGR